MKVEMRCQKCRTKALKVAAKAHESLMLEGEEKDKVVVIGDGVDAVELAKSLRKKVGNTDILSVADVKPN
ncbi:hypothetical protein ACSBR1_026367 [Camellia fascicularis]